MHGGLVRAGGNLKFRTGVHVQLPRGTAGLLVSKSGLNVRHDITSTGLIDEGYEGEIIVKLHNAGDRDYTVHAGDRISQMVIIPVLYVPVEIVDEIEGGERGNAGFGSSGR
jgi:dUTP pyrophosphatase